jgi:hypothetical protein
MKMRKASPHTITLPVSESSYKFLGDLKMNGSVFFPFRQVLVLLCCVLIGSPLIHADGDCEEDVHLALSRLKNFPNIKDWEVSSTANEIRLVSKFKVSASTSQTILVEKFDEKEWVANNQKSFEILIRFQPLMEYQYYQRLRSDRQKWADLLNEDYQALEGEPLSQAEFDEAWKQLDQLKLPSHIAAYSSVFIESPLYSADISFEPDANLQKCVWMLYRLGFLFSEMVH